MRILGKILTFITFGLSALLLTVCYNPFVIIVVNAYLVLLRIGMSAFALLVGMGNDTNCKLTIYNSLLALVIYWFSGAILVLLNHLTLEGIDEFSYSDVKKVKRNPKKIEDYSNAYTAPQSVTEMKFRSTFDVGSVNDLQQYLEDIINNQDIRMLYDCIAGTRIGTMDIHHIEHSIENKLPYIPNFAIVYTNPNINNKKLYHKVPKLIMNRDFPKQDVYGYNSFIITFWYYYNEDIRKDVFSHSDPYSKHSKCYDIVKDIIDSKGIPYTYIYDYNQILKWPEYSNYDIHKAIPEEYDLDKFIISKINEFRKHENNSVIPIVVKV